MQDAGTTTTTLAWVYRGQGAYRYQFTSENSVYQLGDVVRATMTVTNTSGRECYAFSGGFRAEVIDSSGQSVANLVAAAAACRSETPCGTLLDPGGTHSASWCWDQELEPGRLAPPGTYTFEVSWLGGPGRVLFQTVGTPSSPTTTTMAYGLSYC